jgi:hypothetical protein
MTPAASPTPTPTHFPFPHTNISIVCDVTYVTVHHRFITLSLPRISCHVVRS